MNVVKLMPSILLFFYKDSKIVMWYSFVGIYLSIVLDGPSKARTNGLEHHAWAKLECYVNLGLI